LADSGEEALRIAESEQLVDLAILDIRMPSITGIETARRLKNIGIAAMFLSAYYDEDTVKQVVDEGALAYLVKPIDVTKVVPAIESTYKGRWKLMCYLIPSSAWKVH